MGPDVLRERIAEETQLNELELTPEMEEKIQNIEGRYRAQNRSETRQEPANLIIL